LRSLCLDGHAGTEEEEEEGRLKGENSGLSGVLILVMWCLLRGGGKVGKGKG